MDTLKQEPLYVGELPLLSARWGEPEWTEEDNFVIVGLHVGDLPLFSFWCSLNGITIFCESFAGEEKYVDDWRQMVRDLLAMGVKVEPLLELLEKLGYPKYAE